MPSGALAGAGVDLWRVPPGRGFGAVLLSNPCNPTGKHVEGEELARWVATARELDCTLLVDEFYSHYIYRSPPGRLPVESAARQTSSQLQNLSDGVAALVVGPLGGGKHYRFVVGILNLDQVTATPGTV